MSDMQERIPPSPLYDGRARRLVDEAMDKRGEWVGVNSPPPRPGSRVHGILKTRGELGKKDRGGLYPWERALIRSVYWNFQDAGWGGPDGRYSLERRWGTRTPLGRGLYVRVSSRAAGRRAVRKKPVSQRYTETAGQRIGTE